MTLDNTEHIRGLFNSVAIDSKDKLSALMGWGIYEDRSQKTHGFSRGSTSIGTKEIRQCGIK